MSPAELDARLALALSREHWARLAPQLALEAEGSPAELEARALGPLERADLARRLATAGWFRAESIFAPERLAGARAVVLDLVSQGWPPVFAFVYDDLWQLQRTPSLALLLAEVLGPGYRLSPRVWAFCVPAERGASGWPPHVDGGAGTHTSDRLTLWIPLGDATLENGCMAVVPKDVLPPGSADAFANDMSTLAPATWRTMLQAARPLPARSGSLLCWDFQVLHWSTLAGDAEAPRVSLAIEALGEDIVPTPSEEPLLDPAELPPLAGRLRAIARGLLSYERFEPAMRQHASLARRILEALGPG